MTRRLFTALLISALAALAGCKAKPSESACREAILNIRKVRGLDTADVGADPRAAVRSCRAQSSKKTVECYRNAKTEADLDACRGDGEGLEGDEAAQPSDAPADAAAAPGPADAAAAPGSADAAPLAETADAAVEDADETAAGGDKAAAGAGAKPADAPAAADAKTTP